jgi:hypothetical protein
MFPVQNALWWRARQTRVYDRAGFIGTLQGVGCITVFLFIFLLMGFDRRPNLDRHSTLMFLVPLWTGLTLLVVILAATSLVGDRRRGLFELVLATTMEPLEVIDGTLLAIWEHLRWSLCLVWYFALCFCLAGLPGPLESFCSALTATLFCLLLSLYGTLFSLLATTTTRALLATFVFLALANLGMIEILPLGIGPVRWLVWSLSVLVLLAGWLAVRWRPTLATLSWYLLSLHFVLIELATALSRQGLAKGSDYSLLAIAPAHLIMAPLAGPIWRGSDSSTWAWIFFCYCGALAVNFIWVRRWAAKRFDRLTGRTTSPAGRAISPSRTA